MTTREQLAILALLIVLAILAFFFWPAPTKSDVPVVASAVPQSELVGIGSSAVPTTVAVSSPLAECREWALGCRRYPAQTTVGTAEEPSRTPSPSVRAAPSVAPVAALVRPSGQRGASVTGTASWFRSPRGVSAAGPALRTALGSGWRSDRVTVCGPSGCAVTVLGDWCQCYLGTASERLIDLNARVFEAVCGALSRGICPVTVVQ
jgi:hypothetical protein